MGREYGDTCPHGHPLDGTKSNGKGKPRKRCCKTCRSRINHENYLKRKARRQAGVLSESEQARKLAEGQAGESAQ